MIGSFVFGAVAVFVSETDQSRNATGVHGLVSNGARQWTDVEGEIFGAKENNELSPLFLSLSRLGWVARLFRLVLSWAPRSLVITRPGNEADNKN